MSTRSHDRTSRIFLVSALALVAGCFELKQYRGGIDATTDHTLTDAVSDRRDAPDVRDVRADSPDVRDASDVSDASDIGDLGADAACAEGQLRCDGVCVDTSSDSVHCGRCDNVCVTPENGSPVCEASECGFTSSQRVHEEYPPYRTFFQREKETDSPGTRA